MQSQTPNKPRRISALLRQTRLASCLALALTLTTGVRSSMAGDRNLDQPPSLSMRASMVAQGALEPSEVFANIQAWRADHPRSQPLTTTVLGNTHIVTNCNNGGAGSLRQTIATAATGDTIDMRSLECTGIALDTFVPINQDNLTLRGSIVSGQPAPAIRQSFGSENSTGLLVHYGIGTLTVDSLRLSSGTRYESGGCVSSQGNVTIGRSRVSNCKAVAIGLDSAKGGGIYAAGMVVLVDSVIASNSTSSQYGNSRGGGVFAKGEFRSKYSAVIYNRASLIHVYGTSIAGGIHSGGNSIVLDSTIAGNRANYAGGLWVRGTGDIFIRSSTISGNATYDSPALNLATSGGVITVIDTTVTDNYISDYANPERAAGLGIFGSPSSVTIQNSIISGNAELGFNDLEVADGIVVSGDHNLVGDFRGDAPSGIFQRVTPLEPLADNGGPTPTHAIGAGSWAFNRGQTSATQDQRHMPRPVGTGDDIGAFESNVLFIGRFERPTAFVL